MTSSDAVHIVGLVHVEPLVPHAEGKVFTGVLLEADDGKTWVASYSRDPLWQAFDGRRVEVTGVRYIPKDQAIAGPTLP